MFIHVRVVMHVLPWYHEVHMCVHVSAVFHVHAMFMYVCLYMGTCKCSFACTCNVHVCVFMSWHILMSIGMCFRGIVFKSKTCSLVYVDVDVHKTYR